MEGKGARALQEEGSNPESPPKKVFKKEEEDTEDIKGMMKELKKKSGACKGT